MCPKMCIRDRFYVLLELGDDRAAQGLGLGALDGVRLDRGDLAGEVRIGILDAVDAGALGAFDQHLDGAVGQLEHCLLYTSRCV